MLSRRRLALLGALAALGAVGYTAFLGLSVQADLREARSTITGLRVAVEQQDREGQADAIAELRRSVESAEEKTGGAWWGGLTYAPLVGDDLEGVEVIANSLATVAREGLEPALAVTGAFDGVVREGRVDIASLERLTPPVSDAAAAFASADQNLSEIDSSGFFAPLRADFDDYAVQVGDAADALTAADATLDVLPGMLGDSGRRNYLVLFQNNAEIRPLAGMPGSWAHVRTEDGAIEIVRQGSAGDFPRTTEPILPISDEELAVYGEEFGEFFQNPGFDPDFPRAAELWNAHWKAKFPKVELDGVVAADVVALSYLLEGTGPIEVDGRMIDADNAVPELLSRPYIELSTVEQDEFFAEVAREVFAAVTRQPEDVGALLSGVAQAVDERRFLVAPFVGEERERLESTAVSGDFPLPVDSDSPQVAVTFNDGTGSKMSYYLRYKTEVASVECDDGRQRLVGTVDLSQQISLARAASLPQSVYGGNFGTERGGQTVFVRIYSPIGGELRGVSVEGQGVDDDFFDTIDDREVALIPVGLDGKNPVEIEWSAITGEGQTGDGTLLTTPGVDSPTPVREFATFC